MHIVQNIHPEDIDRLNHLLANAMYLQQVYKRYHWMLQGSNFMPLHRLFDEFSQHIIQEIDELGERIRILDGTPLWNPADILQYKTLQEARNDLVDEKDILAEALQFEIAHAQALAEAARTFDHEMATQDILLDLQRQHEKQAWFLKQTLAQRIPETA